MRANPGGQIAPNQVIGRDELINRLWDILQRQSLIIHAARRMGKTVVLQKMRAEPRNGLLLAYRDLERAQTATEFAELVLDDVRTHLSLKGRAIGRVQALLKRLGGTEIGGVIKLPEGTAQHWKQLLSETIEDLVTSQEPGIVFLWDELPLMLDNIRRSQGEGVAMEVLDLLRALRQTHPSLRMVFTGSIGLHHVIAALRQHGHSNPATNDMCPEEVPPLEPGDARDLASRLLEGEAIACRDRDAVAHTVAESTGAVPFYIHHVVDQIKRSRLAGSPETAQQVVTDCLTDPQDRWDMGHWIHRISTYYVERSRRLAFGVLDAVAGSAAPVTFDELFNLVKAKLKVGNPETMRAVLELLEKDHYLRVSAEGRYSFRYHLLRRYWSIKRGSHA